MTLFLATAFLFAVELQVDHVTVAGADLKQMQARLAVIGIPTEFGGPHSNGATQMALASFPDGSYLELIAPQANPNQKALDSHYWSKEMKGNAGPTAWAVRVNDVPVEAARLKAAGIAVSAPSRSGRARPDGVKLDWETADVGDAVKGMFFPFLIRDFTPRNARAFPTGHPTTAAYSGVKRVVIAVRDLKASIAQYRKAYLLSAPLEHPDEDFGGVMASFAGTPVILAAPINEKSWIAQRLEKFGEGPCAFILGSKTRNGSQVSWFDVEKLGWHLGYVN